MLSTGTAASQFIDEPAFSKRGLPRLVFMMVFKFRGEASTDGVLVLDTSDPAGGASRRYSETLNYSFS